MQDDCCHKHVVRECVHVSLVHMASTRGGACLLDQKAELLGGGSDMLQRSVYIVQQLMWQARLEVQVGMPSQVRHIALLHRRHRLHVRCQLLSAKRHESCHALHNTKSRQWNDAKCCVICDTRVQCSSLSTTPWDHCSGATQVVVTVLVLCVGRTRP